MSHGDVVPSKLFVPGNLGNEIRKKSVILREKAEFLQKLSQALDSLAAIMDRIKQCQDQGQTASIPELVNSLVEIANIMKLGGCVEEKPILELTEKVMSQLTEKIQLY